ncbi:MAG: hypothetical protein KJ726_05040 [Verrucomicrobia bacterium]|nr:hypothetical protein [Verrucomicrobiota bacterium]MBU1909395.1 hypothetical protein [Verrucomicrobiota bacterium]
MKRLLVNKAVICGAALVGLIAWRDAQAQADFPAQQIVDSLVALQPSRGGKQMMELMRTGTATNKFDVNRYFAVLNALRPENGCVLDWVYWRRGGMGGLPVLYAKRTNEAPYVSFENYVALSTNASFGKTERELKANDDFFFGYLDKVHAEDSPQGFFELIVLRLIGDRFHLFWHEWYSETALVCSRQGWEALIQKEKQRGDPYDPPPADFIAAADKLDFFPRIRMGDKQVEINVLTYSPFRGLDLHCFEVARPYPHRITKHTQTNLVSHRQGFVF